MRIVMLSWRLPGDPRAGGAEALTVEILKRAVARGHEATWFGASAPGQTSDETIEGIRCIRRGRQWTVHAHAWRWLRSSGEQFDVVVDQINTLPFLTPFYVPESRRRLLIWQTAREYWWRETRGLFALAAPFGYLAEPQYLKAYRSTRTITISASTRTELVELGHSPALVTVIPIAVSTPALPALEAKEGPLRLVAIGRLTPAKFVEEVVEAFTIVHARAPDSVLEIAGSGDPGYRRKLEHRIEQAGLGGAVVFHGRVTDEGKRDLLTRAHVHVFASHREGWGLTVTEAAARGTPSVGYDAPGVRDSIRDRRLLAPLPSGAAGLAERVLALRLDPELYEKTRIEAWEYARTLSYDATTEAFLDAIHP